MIHLAPHARRAACATLAISATAALGRAQSATPAKSVATLPLCPGLTIVTAVSDRDGDYESIKTVQSVDEGAIVLRYSSERKENGTLQKIKVQRKVLLKDMRDATLYMHHFHNRGAVTVPGTTAIGTSSAVLRALERTGRAELGIFDGTYSASPADPGVHPNIYDYEDVEIIQRAGSGTVSVPVLVNDVPATLPAIEARGDYSGDKADFLFLADEANPIALRYRIGKDALDVVKISYRCDPRAGDHAGARSRLEQSLLETGRADVYSIYFSFNSAELREESDSTLLEIADVLRRHPEWKLAINGHTDAIGGDAYNLDLSRRRAAAVKEALVGREGVAAGRLTTAGFGERNPKDTNETLEGRARNRRVELVRTS